MDKDQFSFAAESCKQILTFSTAILTLTVTFAKDTFVKDKQSVPWSLRVSWICYLLSIFATFWTLLALTGEFAKSGQPDLYAWNVKVPATAMVTLFCVGLVLTVVAGWHATRAGKKQTPSSHPVEPPEQPESLPKPADAKNSAGAHPR